MRLRFKAAFGLALVILTAPAPAVFAAASARLRLLRSADGGVLFREVVARTAGEVVAAGFSVDLLEIAPGGLGR